VAEGVGIAAVEEVHPLHQGIQSEGQLHAGGHPQQGGIIAHAQGDVVPRCAAALEKAVDEIEFGKGHPERERRDLGFCSVGRRRRASLSNTPLT